MLVVVKESGERLLSVSMALRADLLALETRMGIAIDPLILTATEFESRPLRNMDELVRIM